MAGSKTFDVMYELLASIKQIDRIVASKEDNENILEDVLIAVKEINIDQFSDHIKENIVSNIRTGVVEMYEEQLAAVNKEIGLCTSFNMVENFDCNNIIDIDTVRPADKLMKKGTNPEVHHMPKMSVKEG